MDSLKELAEALIKQAKREDIYLVLRFADTKSRYFNAKGGKIDKVNLMEQEGCGIQAFTKKGYFSFVSVDTMSDERKLKVALEKSIKTARAAEESQFEPLPQLFDLKKEVGEKRQKYEKNPFEISSGKVQEDLLKFQNSLEYDDFSKSNSLFFSRSDWRIFRSDGTDVGTTILVGDLFTFLSAKSKENPIEVFAKISGNGYEVFSSQNKSIHKKELSLLAEYARKYKSAKNLSGGNWPTILDGSIGGTFIHEAFGHTAESDVYYQKSPLLQNGKIKKGFKVAGTFVNIYDHAEVKDRGFFPYSGYGVKREKVDIVKEGKVNNLLSDLATFKKVGVQLNGASRMQSFSNIPIPRMSCTQIDLDGNKTIDTDFDTKTARVRKIYKVLIENNVFKKYPEIIYLKQSTGGNVDTNEGNFQFRALVSYKLTIDSIEPIKPVSFSGKTLEALRSIVLAFGKKHVSVGICGKAGQSIAESTKAPMLLLKPNKHVFVG